MTVDQAVSELEAAISMPEFQRLTEFQRILNEVSDAAFLRGVHSEW